MATLHIPRRHLRKSKYWTIIGLFYVPFELKKKMKNWTYHHSTGFLNLHTCYFKQRYIAGSAKCSRETSFQIINMYFIGGQNGLQSYCDTSYLRGGVNQMSILKNSKDLLEYIQSRSLSSCNSIKTFDLPTLYTTISHSKLKDKLKELVQLCFKKKNGQRIYKNLVLGRDRSYFVKKNHSDSINKFSETDIINMLLFLLTTYLLSLVDVFFNTVGIPMDTNCCPLLVDLFLCSYKADFI
jgi:hypothetical protein